MGINNFNRDQRRITLVAPADGTIFSSNPGRIQFTWVTTHFYMMGWRTLTVRNVSTGKIVFSVSIDGDMDEAITQDWAAGMYSWNVSYIDQQGMITPTWYFFLGSSMLVPNLLKLK